MAQTEMFPEKEYPTQKSGPVTSYYFTSGGSSEPPSGLVINDACHPIEVASCLWEGKRAFFHAILQDTKSIPGQAVLHLWKNTPEEVRKRLLGWAPRWCPVGREKGGLPLLP